VRYFWSHYGLKCFLPLEGDADRILDLDALVMENAYLKQELTRLQEEQSKAVAALSKYRAAQEKRMTKSLERVHTGLEFGDKI
jgi:hypothetical protein